MQKYRFQKSHSLTLESILRVEFNKLVKKDVTQMASSLPDCTFYGYFELVRSQHVFFNTLMDSQLEPAPIFCPE
jgi:hypothetical protein